MGRLLIIECVSDDQYSQSVSHEYNAERYRDNKLYSAFLTA